MNKYNPHSLSLYRRHQPKCPLKGKPRIIDSCRCPLYYQGRLHGVYVRKGVDTRSHIAAGQKVEAILAAPAGGPQDDPHGGIRLVPKAPTGDVTLEFAISEFIESVKNLASKTKRNYSNAVKHFYKWAEAQPLTTLKEIGTSDIDRYFEQAGRTKRGTKWTLKTIDSRLTHLRVFFNYCVDPQHWLPYAPTKDRRMFKRLTGADDATEERKPFTRDEVSRILLAVERMPIEVRDKTRALVLLMLTSGMRISDATFFERAYLDGRKARYWIIKTRRKIALAPTLSQKCVDALAALPPSRVYYFQEDREGDCQEARYALRHKQEFGKHMPDYDARIRATTALIEKVLKLAGITEGACHRFRDTFAVAMLTGDGGQNRADLLTVSRMLGHSDPKITAEHYVKLVEGYEEFMSQQTRVLAYVFPEAA